MANKKYNEFVAGVPAGTDLVLFGNPTTGLLKKTTIDNFTGSIGLIMRTKITKTFADFAAAATVNSISSGFTLPAGGLIHDIQINPTIAFSGGAISSYAINIGIAGTTSKWASAKPIFTGAAPSKTVPGTASLHSMSASVDVLLTVNCTGANLDQATQGVVDIWIYYSVLS